MPDVSMSGISFRIAGDASEASRAIATLTKEIEKLNSTLSRSNGIKSFSSNMRKIGGSSKGGFSAFKSIAAPFKSGFQDVSRFAKGLGTVFNAFKRIAMYRILRSIIKEITQAFAEGTKNLYGWSKAVGGATIKGKTFAQTMDSLATSGGYFKNSIGAMVAPIISALAPAIDFIIDKIVALINVINQLFALLGGATSWNKATRKAQEFEDAAGGAGGAAKEALRYLAPFDELNVLPDEKSGGGGGGTDYSGMFEETSEFMEGLKDFVESIKEKVAEADWQGLGELIGGKVNELIDKIDFAGIGAKVGGFINAWFTTRYWTLETINFQNIGAKIAEFFNNAISGIDFSVIGATVVQKFTIIGDFIIGAITNLDWGMIAAKTGEFLKGALDHLSGWLGDVNWANVAHMIYIKLGDAISGIDWSGIVSSIAQLIGSGIGAAAAFMMQLGLDLAVSLWGYIKDAFNNADSNGDGKLTGKEIIDGIKRGIVNAVTSIGTWIKDNIWTPFIDGIKSAFGIASPATTMVEPGEMISEGLLKGITDKIKEFPDKIAEAWTLVSAWFADLPAKLKQAGIDAINAFSSMFISGLNDLIAKINNSGLAQALGIDIKPIEFEMIPNIPESELTKNYDEAKAALEAASQENPVEVKGKLTGGIGGGLADFLGDDLPTVDVVASVSGFDTDSDGNLRAPFQPLLASKAMAAGIELNSDGSIKTTFSEPWMNVKAWPYIPSWYKNSDGSLKGDIGNPWINVKSWPYIPSWYKNSDGSLKGDIGSPWIKVSASVDTYTVSGSLTDAAGRMKIRANAVIESTTNAYMNAKGGVYSGGQWHNIQQYASGGFARGSQLFWAREQGPELVGTLGSHTAVMNNDQIVASVSAGVARAIAGIRFQLQGVGSAAPVQTSGTDEDALYRAFRKALDETDFGGDIDLDGDALYRSVVRRNRQNTRATGVNQLAMA